MDIKEKLDKAFLDPVRLQVFRTVIGTDSIEDAVKRHITEISNAILLSRFCKFQGVMFDEPLYCMSGFMEQVGRLPIESDRIHIIRGRTYFDVVGPYIESEIGIIILT